MNIYDDISRLMNNYGTARAPTPEENLEHFKRVIICEDDTELNAYAVANIRMVASAVTKFLKRHPRAVYLLDDLFSTALCTMFYSLHSLVNQVKENPEKFWSEYGKITEDGKFTVAIYLYISIYKNIQECYENEAVKAISDRSRWNFTPINRQEPIRKRSLGTSDRFHFHYDHFDLVYLWDDILEHCETDFERSIVRMRTGMGDREIAESLGCTQQWVSRTRDIIHARYERSLCKFSE